MHSLDFEKYKQELNALRSFLVSINGFQSVLGLIGDESEPSILDSQLITLRNYSPDARHWRVMEHTLAISQIYANYENFCEHVLEKWVSYCSQRLAYADLPKGIFDYYPKGFSKLISLMPSPRYPSLTVQSLVSNYNAALDGQEGYQIDADCLVHHENNLRWDELSKIFSRCGLEGLWGWMDASPELREYFNTPVSTADQFRSKLADFVQYRNDASHGVVSPDEILGHEELLDMIDFLMRVGSSIDQFIEWKKVEIDLNLGCAESLGEVTEVFAKSNAFICKMECAKLTVGQIISFKYGSSFRSAEVISLQDQGRPVELWTGKVESELGIVCNVLPRKKTKIFSKS